MSSDEFRAREKLQSDYSVSRETMSALDAYEALLKKWAKQINLVGPSTIQSFWQRHALDSAQILTISGPGTSRIADFGSGAGLPGLILAALIADKQPDHLVTLVESSAKRCGFLREASRVLGVKTAIQHIKIEALAPVTVDFVTARAFAPLDKLLNYAQPWAQKGARIIFLKGADVQQEIDEASTSWSFQAHIKTSVTDSRGCVLEILNLQRL
jgi:16S rRNA (guanine527-N7)-methyltransferase